jgi:hypothetical protein
MRKWEQKGDRPYHNATMVSTYLASPLALVP